jgi:hypothetical protein
MERFYATARDAEHLLDLPGREVREARLRWERERWLLRLSTDAVVQQVAGERARGRATAALDRGSPPGLPQGQPIGPAHQWGREAHENPQPSRRGGDPPADPMQRAYEISELIVRAGQHAGSIHRGERISSDFAFTKSPGAAVFKMRQ